MVKFLVDIVWWTCGVSISFEIWGTLMNIRWHWWEHENIAETCWNYVMKNLHNWNFKKGFWCFLLRKIPWTGLNLVHYMGRIWDPGDVTYRSDGGLQLGGVQLQVGNEGFRQLRICFKHKHRQIQMVRNTKQTNQHAKCTTVYNSVVSRPLISCCINFQNLRIAFKRPPNPKIFQATLSSQKHHHP